MKNEDLTCCYNCKYWDAYMDSKENKMVYYGICRRYPPNIPCLDESYSVDGCAPINNLCFTLMQGLPLVSQPYTFDEDWCGEFAMKNEIEVEWT